MNSNKSKVYLNPMLFPPKPPQVDQPPPKQLSLYDLQQQTDGMRAMYQSKQLEYKALTLAYEALRLVWLISGGNVAGSRKQGEVLDGAIQSIAEHLLPAGPVVSDEPVPVAMPDWLEAA